MLDEEVKQSFDTFKDCGTRYLYHCHAI